MICMSSAIELANELWKYQSPLDDSPFRYVPETLALLSAETPCGNSRSFPPYHKHPSEDWLKGVASKHKNVGDVGIRYVEPNIFRGRNTGLAMPEGLIRFISEYRGNKLTVDQMADIFMGSGYFGGIREKYENVGNLLRDMLGAKELGEYLDYRVIPNLFIGSREELGATGPFYSIVPSTVFWDDGKDPNVLSFDRVYTENKFSMSEAFRRTRNVTAVLTDGYVESRHFASAGAWGRRYLIESQMKSSGVGFIDDTNVDAAIQIFTTMIEMFNEAYQINSFNTKACLLTKVSELSETGEEDILNLQDQEIFDLYLRVKKLLLSIGVDGYWNIDIAGNVFNSVRASDTIDRLFCIRNYLERLKEVKDESVQRAVFPMVIEYLPASDIVLVVNGTRDPREIDYQLGEINSESYRAVWVDENYKKEARVLLDKHGLQDLFRVGTPPTPVQERCIQKVEDDLTTGEFYPLARDMITKIYEREPEELQDEIQAMVSYLNARRIQLELVKRGFLVPLLKRSEIIRDAGNLLLPPSYGLFEPINNL